MNEYDVKYENQLIFHSNRVIYFTSLLRFLTNSFKTDISRQDLDLSLDACAKIEFNVKCKETCTVKEKCDVISRDWFYAA